MSFPLVEVFHIGVGSGVVCSTLIGNARASVRGTDDKRFPRFFMLVEQMLNLLVREHTAIMFVKISKKYYLLTNTNQISTI